MEAAPPIWTSRPFFSDKVLGESIRKSENKELGKFGLWRSSISCFMPSLYRSTASYTISRIELAEIIIQLEEVSRKLNKHSCTKNTKAL